VVSVTNHTPFTSKEPALDIAGHATPRERILNTTHYTDDVVREFIATLAREPWFERTIVVIYGDHGFNLGEHGGMTGEVDLYREGSWVPLVILGSHPRLPRGPSAQPASLLDIAPTLADLLGIREANPWQGHSLLASAPERSFQYVAHGLVLSEEGGQTVVTDPRTGAAALYNRNRDWLQHRPLAASEATRAALARRAMAAGRLNDYLLRRDLVWRRDAR